MKYLCILPLVLTVLFQVETAYSAEPPASCKLELIRLTQLPPGKERPKDEILLRPGGRVLLNADLGDKGEQHRNAVEKEFRDAIQKEPGEYQATHPVRGVTTLGGREYGFVFDKQSKNSQDYDRLYFDLNGNGDLTDDVPIDVPEYRQGYCSGDERYTLCDFPRVDIKISAEETQWDYSFWLWVELKHRGEEVVSLNSMLFPAAYRKGEITLAGKQHAIILLDRNAHGRFDVPVYFPREPDMFSDSLMRKFEMEILEGTEILFDPDPPTERYLGAEYRGEHRQFLSKMNVLGGRFYNIKVQPGGDELTCTPIEAPLGEIVVSQMPCNLWLINKQGFLALDFQEDIPTEIPAGVWRLLYWNNHYCYNEYEPLTVTAAQTSKFNKLLKRSDPNVGYLIQSGDQGMETIVVIYVTFGVLLCVIVVCYVVARRKNRSRHQ